MIPEPGRRFGPYEIQGRLGGGGMGYVFRAWDARLHREVAVKLLHNEYAMPGMRERFLREARAASVLNHPNICTIFDIGEQDGEPYLVMELLEGVSLKDRILDVSMPYDEIVCVAREIAEGLGAAHSKGVIHRDIKPANIFLVKKPNGSFQAKILDFGLAKIEGGVLGARGGRNVDITTAGATVGTLAYMSPEQARGEVLDSRSDLFSLGVVLYEMATRRIPFPGATSALVFVKLLNHPPPPVREWNEAIPRDLEKVIFKLMAKERTARYQTAGELEQALKQLDERGSGGAGNWLRKAVAANPLGRAGEGRAPEPPARERKPSRRSEQDLPDVSPEPELENPAPTYGPSFSLSAPQPPTSLTPSSQTEPQFLRPVARIPRREVSAPASDPSGTLSTGTLTGGTLNSGTLTGGQQASSTGIVPPRMRPASVITAPGSGAIAAASSSVAVGFDSEPSTPPLVTQPAVLPASSSSARPAAVPVAESHVLTSVSAVADHAAAEPRLVPLAQQPPADGRPAIRKQKNQIRLNARLIVVGLVLLVVITIVAAFIVHHGRFGPTMLTDKDTVVMTEIDNRTGESSLDQTVASAFSIVLAQSPYLALRGEEDYQMARHQVLLQTGGGAPTGQALAHAAARRLRTKAYFFGTLTGAAPPYQLHVDLLDTESNDVMTSVDEVVPSLEQLPSAIDRAAGELRANAGEDSDTIARAQVPLAQDATASLEAMHSYASGEAAAASGNLLDALALYQRAAEADPRFTQAQIHLAVLYRRLHAELAAADAARLALTASNHASERVRSMAQYVYQLDATGDYSRAATNMRHLLTEFPGDPQAQIELARVLRLEGHMSEALGIAQEAIASDPFNADAYTQAEDALIGLDRYDAAYQLNLQAERMGLAKGGATLVSAYLEGRESAVTEALSFFEKRTPADAQNLRADWTYGIYLDNIGQLKSGSAVWQTDAALAGAQDRGLASAGSFLLAQGALDRALLGDCGPALDMAHAAARTRGGMHAIFNQGMAESLCGDRAGATAAMSALHTGYPQSFAVTSFYLADIQGALELTANNPAAALETLRPATQFDLISLTAYLRGRAHVSNGEAQVGIVDFQTVLAHRGTTFVIGSDVYPAAAVGVARAFAETGDTNNSSQAYRRFLTLWKDADAGQPLLTEAEQHVR